MSRPSAVLVGAIALLLAGCDQLGNPQQYATAPTPWRGQHAHVVTTTRSFKNEATIRRIVSEGMEDLDYADPSIGPSQTLTIVIVVPRTLRLTRRPTVKLVTTFRLQDRQPISRTWQAPSAGNKWSAAFALPEPPTGAVTVVAP